MSADAAKVPPQTRLLSILVGEIVYSKLKYSHTVKFLLSVCKSCGPKQYWSQLKDHTVFTIKA